MKLSCSFPARLLCWRIDHSLFRIMRLTFVLLLSTCLYAQAEVYAQRVTISVKNTPLEQVFKEISRQTNYQFFFRDEFLYSMDKVSIHVKDADFKTVLEDCFRGKPLSFSIVNNIIVVRRINPPPPPGFSLKLLEREDATEPELPDIRGSVNDAISGKPLEGATVQVKGSAVSVVTNFEGEFVLKGVDSKATLVISFVGYATATVELKGKLNIVVNLNPVVSQMNETVVVAYGKSKIRDITGSISSISTQDIKNAPMGASLQSLIQGRSAGVNVNIQSASPSSPVSVVIRGASSISGSNQPLWVIDGIPDYSQTSSGNIANTLFNLNINDVQSIEILKDASATALYGSRAANGVVIVTTKRGAEGAKPTIQFTSRWGLQVQNFNGYKYMEAEEYLRFADRAARIEAYGRGSFDYFTRLYLDEQAFMKTNSSEFDMNTFKVLPGAYYEGNTNWQKEMTHNPWNKQYDLSLRGGAKNLAYYVSLNHRMDEGIVKSGDAKSFGGRLNLEAKLRKGIKLGINLSGNSRQVDDKDYMLDVLKKIRPDIPPFNPDGTLFTRDAYTENPYTTLKNTRYSNSQAFIGQMFLELDLMKSLVFRTAYSTQFTKGESLNYTRRGSTFNYDGTRTRNDSKNNTNSWENTLTFAKNFGDHDVTAMAGLSMERFQSNDFGMTATNFPDDDVLNNFTSGAVRGALTESKSANALLSQYARAHYKYKDRYIISGTIRRDGSSRFGPDKRWGIFPSAAVAWIISEEEFFKKSGISNFVSYIKLRASRGLAGSQNLGNYDWRTNVNSSRYNEIPAIAPSSVGNTELQWEEAELTDFGIDFGLWNERIRGTFGVYRKITNHLIYSQPLPPSTSFSSINSNVGSVKNNGVEFDVTADILKNKDFSLQVDFNASTNINRIMKINGVVKELLFPSSYTIYMKVLEGQRTGQWFGYKTAGRLFVSPEEVIALKGRSATGGQTNYRASYENKGDLIFLDQDGNGVINTDDRTTLGSADPKYYGGFGVTASYKSFRINATFTYAYGHKRLWKMPMDDVGYVGNYNHANKIAGKSATLLSPYDAIIPRMTHYGDGGNGTFSDFWLYDASYLRLSALNLVYRVPSTFFRNWVIQGIDLSFQASNLITLTKYPGFDPQGNWSSSAIGTGMGVDNSTYPSARNFNFSVMFTFK